MMIRELCSFKNMGKKFRKSKHSMNYLDILNISSIDTYKQKVKTLLVQSKDTGSIPVFPANKTISRIIFTSNVGSIPTFFDIEKIAKRKGNCLLNSQKIKYYLIRWFFYF